MALKTLKWVDEQLEQSKSTSKLIMQLITLREMPPELAAETEQRIIELEQEVEALMNKINFEKTLLSN